MRLRNLAFVLGAAGVATLAYGAVVEARTLVLERRTLALPSWPERLRGYRIALLSDFHIGSRLSVDITRRAIAMALDEEPDAVVIAGDFVQVWRHESPWLLGECLEPLLMMEGNVIAVPGNHDYNHGDPEFLRMICDELNIKLLRNEVWKHAGINWVGIDSGTEQRADPVGAMAQTSSGPCIAVWHEPDLVDYLPVGCSLQLSGHSHGGQFRFPGGFTPMYTKHGRKYPRGFYPDAPTPLYVSRGIGTTFVPSRFLCPPEVTILTLVPDDQFAV
ncbi:MAG: metallophosphoesterase [Fimbriimonas sp.]|nr:metallophosphoesterase [Fimbriimonas sp.]